MNIKNILKDTVFVGCMALGATLSSCNDWLTLYPMDKIVEENFWEDKNDLESVRNEAYKSMTSSANITRYLIWGEFRSDNFDRVSTNTDQNLMDLMNTTLKATNSFFDWSSIYSTINYCNKVIQHGPEIREKDKSFSEGDWEAIRAEMYALRALNYFYLTRTFDSIPLVLEAINDDSEVEPIKASSQMEVLDTLITQLEEICSKNMMAQNYGNDADNKGLITDKAVYTILADIYLWRASVLEPTSLQAAQKDYERCADLCTKVLTRMEEDYQNNNLGGNRRPGSSNNDEDNPYHLYQNEGAEGETVTNGAYDNIFGTKNSRESIFELQFDTKNVNSAVSSYYMFSGSNGAIIAASQLKTIITANTAENASTNLFYVTDFRRWESMNESSTDYYINKYSASRVDQMKTTENNNTVMEPSKEFRLQNQCDANWIFYRISDVMLMKAEALCRLNRSEKDLTDAFALVEQIFKRSNPYATTAEELKQANYANQEDMENLILRERRREFIGEGKRWFDVVRYALRQGQEKSSEAAFELIQNKFSGNALNTTRNKYKQGIQVLYAPIYEDELKANPLLNQNPIWDQGTTIEKN